MTKQDKQKLNEKLAKWAGFTHVPYQKDDYGRKLNDDCWLQPNEIMQCGNNWSFKPPNFTDSLDACFRWLVPKLSKKGHWIGLITTEC